MKSAELLAEINATQELESMGWKKTICTYCNGTGTIFLRDNKSIPIVGDVICADNTCYHCDGTGWIWTSPITK